MLKENLYILIYCLRFVIVSSCSQIEVIKRNYDKTVKIISKSVIDIIGDKAAAHITQI